MRKFDWDYDGRSFLRHPHLMTMRGRSVTEVDPRRDARIAWWREAKFEMFIHWGLYALPAGEWEGKRYPGIGEWIQFNAGIPVDEYAQLSRQFRPTAFDADDWAQLAQDAGMKYLVFTARHHDGFAMFHSKVSDFNIVDASPSVPRPVRPPTVLPAPDRARRSRPAAAHPPRQAPESAREWKVREAARCQRWGFLGDRSLYSFAEPITLKYQLNSPRFQGRVSHA